MRYLLSALAILVSIDASAADEVYEQAGGIPGDGVFERSLMADTTPDDAGAYTMFSETLADDSIYQYDIRCAGHDTDGTDFAAFHFFAVATRDNGGSADIRGSVIVLDSFPIKSLGAVLWTASVAEDGNDIEINVSGGAGNDDEIQWLCDIERDSAYQ